MSTSSNDDKLRECVIKKKNITELRLWTIIFSQLILWVGIWGLFDTTIKHIFMNSFCKQISAYVSILLIGSVLYYIQNGNTYYSYIS